MASVIDAHHHFLDPDRIAYPFLRFLPELARFTGPDELAPLLREAGVRQTVVVQAADCEEETAFLLAQAARASWVAGVVGWLPLADPGATAAALARHAGSALRGVRHLIHDEPDPDWVVQPAVLESLRLLADAGLAFDLSAFSARHLSHVTRLAETAPALDVVVCHYGFPRVDQGEWEPWASGFAEAAKNPRCVVKVSGLDMTIGGCDVSRWRPYFEHALRCFGPARMVWASNWPVSLRARGYRELLDAAHALVAGLPAAEQEAILGGNARRVYRLPG